jgi:hypothetical protein
MHSYRLIVGVISVAFAVFLAATPAHAVLIDNFNDGTFVFTDGGFGAFVGAGIIGGERDVTTGPNTTSQVSANNFGNGRLSMNFESGPSAAFVVDVFYDGTDGTLVNDFTGLNKTDFTDGGSSDAIRVRLIQSSIALAIEITVSENNGPPAPGSEWSLQQLIVVGPTSSPTDVFFPFEDFQVNCSFCGTASFSSIDWMRVRYFSPGGVPFQASVDFIQTQSLPDGPRAAPEPATIPLLTGAIVGLVLASRRVRNKGRSG